MEKNIKIITYRGTPGRDAPDLKPFVMEQIKSLESDLRGLIVSKFDSQELANGVFDTSVREIEQKVSEIDALINSKVASSDFTELQKQLAKFIENLNATISLRATKAELEAVKSSIPAPVNIVAGSENVQVVKENDTFKISVDVQEKVTETVIKEVAKGGGVSKKFVMDYVDSAVEAIEISGGSGTVTNITSHDGSIIVTPIVDGYDLQVASVAVSGDFVSKTGDTMTGTLAMSGAAIQLDVNHTPAHSEGTIFYDSEFKTLSYYNDNPDVTINVGQENVVRVRNNTGSLIANGKVVCINGSSGSHPLIVLADNTSPTLSHSTLGVATHNLSDNENGYVTTSGLVNGLNTSMYSTEGVVLWLDTNGNITETEPTAPTHKVKIGYLVRKHINHGRILVAIDTGSDLKDLHDVTIGDYEDGALLVASGAVWQPGANVNDLATKSEVAQVSGGLDVRLDLLEAIKDDTNEPNGFVNRTDSTLYYTPSTATFAISGSYSVYLDGNKFNKFGDSVTLTPAYGTQYIYYVYNSGNFTVSPTLFDIAKDAPIAYVFFNDGATDSFLAEERHGITMDGVTHQYLHRTVGAKYVSGMTLGDYVLNSDTVGNNKYSIAAGTFYDEDILNSVPALADNGPYNVFYRTGASGNWTWSKAEAYPYFIDTNSIRYNQFTGGAWQLTNITTNNRWVNYYVFATNAITPGFEYVIIPGQAIYTSLALAQGESVSNLSLGNLPFAEIVPVARVTHQFSTGYANANGRARIVAVASLTATSFVSAIATASNHNSLSGLQGGTAGEYYHLTAAQSDDWIGKSEVTSVSGSLVTFINSGDSNLQNQIDDLVSVTGDYALSSDLSNYTLLSTTASISGDLQSQINNIVEEGTTIASSGGTIIVTQDNIDFNLEVADYISKTEVISISDGLQQQINASVGIQGRFQLSDTTNTFTITHMEIDEATDFPVCSLEVSSSGSDLFIVGIHDRTSNSFKVTLSGLPSSTDYILWHISTTSSISDDLQAQIDTITISGSSYVQVFTEDGIWYKPEGAKTVEVWLIGGGAGGDGGQLTTLGTASRGGNGGRGASAILFTFEASAISGAAEVIIGAGGAGGLGGTGLSNPSGTQGGETYFGTYAGTQKVFTNGVYNYGSGGNGATGLGQNAGAAGGGSSGGGGGGGVSAAGILFPGGKGGAILFPVYKEVATYAESSDSVAYEPGQGGEAGGGGGVGSNGYYNGTNGRKWGGGGGGGGGGISDGGLTAGGNGGNGADGVAVIITRK
jgi:hypothetical protein